MERRKKYLKALAFVPAIVLVGGFVGCHAGAFKMFEKATPQPEPQPVAETQPPAPTPPPAPDPAPASKPTFMAGSKSMKIVIPRPAEPTPSDQQAPAAPTQPVPPKLPVFMGGPKSAPIIGPTQGLTPGGTFVPPNQPPTPPKP